MVHVDLARELFHLAGLGVEVLLQDGELFGHLQTGLALHDLSDLLYLLFFLMAQYFLLDHLLGLVDQSFLESLYLLLHLVDIGVGSFQVAASVNIERILELFG